MDEAPQKFPPEEWFAAVAGGHPQRVAFRDINGDTEFVKAEWMEENVFELKESPLLVDGVSIWDFVEVEWREGSVEPHFLRSDMDDDDPWRCRTIRARAGASEVRKFVQDCDSSNIHCFAPHRSERGIFVTAIRPDSIEYLKERDPYYLSYILPGEWVFTDTGTQE